MQAEVIFQAVVIYLIVAVVTCILLRNATKEILIFTNPAGYAACFVPVLQAVLIIGCIALICTCKRTRKEVAKEAMEIKGKMKKSKTPKKPYKKPTIQFEDFRKSEEPKGCKHM